MNIQSSTISIKPPEGPRFKTCNNFLEIRQYLLKNNPLGIFEKSSHNNSYATLKLDGGFGSGNLDFLSFDEDLSVIIADATFNQDQNFNLKGDEWLRFHFRLSLKNSLSFDTNEHYKISGQISQLLLLPESCDHTDSFMAFDQMQWVSIYCLRSTITERYQIDPAILGNEIRDCLSNDAQLYVEHRDLGNNALSILRKIFSCNLPRGLKKIYLKAKVLELLTDYLADSLSGVHTAKNVVSLKSYDIARITEAKRLLESELTEEMGIQKLSKLVGLNRTKLTAGFKHLFKKTPHEFHTEQRLKKAWDLLEQEDCSVALIANEVGYSHHPSFTTAFKKHFGTSPKDVRKKHRHEAHSN